jgi:hypothetical protein
LKRIVLILLAAVIVSFGATFSFAAENPSSGKVIAYYLHGSGRCSNCIKFEQYSKEAIEANFKNELAAGKLEFKVFNVEEQNNEHFVQDYQLYTKSLIISLIKDGKEVKFKNLEKIWEFVRNKQKFYDYVMQEINNFLKES